MNTKNKINTSKKIERNNRVIYSILIIILSLCIIFGVAFAVFNYKKAGEVSNTTTTGTLIVTLDDLTSSGILVEKAVPTSDEVGKTLTPYTFTIENEGTLNSNYRIKIVDDLEDIALDGCGNKLLDHSQVRYQLVKNNEEYDVHYLDNDINRIIDFGVIKPDEVNEYELRLWIDSAITDPTLVNGKHLHVKISVDAIQDKYIDFDDIN